MSNVEIIALIVTIICLLSFCLVFTFLFRHYYLNLIKDVNEGKEDIDLIDSAIIEEEEKKSKKKKALKITGKVVGYTLLGIVVLFFLSSLVSKFMNDKIVVGDSTMIVIASGSMEERNEANSYLDEFNLNNQINTYDIVGITKYKDQSEVKLYDVVAFKGDDNVTYVHRIIDIKENNTYVTRGDSNNLSDNDGRLYKGNLTFDRIIGKYNGTRIKTVGIFVVFLQSNSGIITVISIIYCMLMFDHFRNKYDKAIEERTNKLIELLEYNLSEHKSVDFSTKYHETLIYKGNKYIFENGNFISKSDLEESDLLNNEDTSSSLVVIKENNDEESNVTIKNIKTNKEDTFKEKKSNVFSKIKDFFRKDKSKENKESKETNNDNLSEM